MLYLDTSLEIEGLTLFRDFNTPNRYYYMPRAPRLTLEAGAPMFQLLIYARDITDNPDFHEGDRAGGGFLTMTVDLGVPQSVLDAVRGHLGGNVELAPVPFEDGSVRVSALGVVTGGAAEAEAAARRGPRFVEQIIAFARPSLVNDNRAVFTIELSQEGATLMQASLQDGGASQVAVIYDLAYRGLLPAYEVKITIDFKQSYDYLRTRFTANTLWFKADIDTEVERLRKEGHIKIEEADYLQSDPTKLAERAPRLEALAKELATWSFFKPGLTPGKVIADDRGNITVYDPVPDAKKNEAGFTAPLLAAGTGRGSPTDVQGARLPGEAATPGGTRVGGDPTPAPVGVPAAPAEGAAGSGNAVEAWNRMGRPQAAFLLKSLSQEEQQTITFDLRQVAASRRSAAPQGSIRLMPGAAALPGRIRKVDLADPFFERIAGSVTSSADFEAAGVGSMVVKLRYGVRDDGTAPKDTQEFVLNKTGDKGSFAFLMDRRRAVELEYQVVLTCRAGFAIGDAAPQITSPWIRTTTRNLDIDPHFIGPIFPVSLVAGAIDWTQVRSVQSVVRYEDRSHGVHGERMVVLKQDAPAAVVPIRPPEGGTTAFTVTSTFFYGTVQEVVTTTGSGASTITLNPPAERIVPISVNAADPLARFRRIVVELAYRGGDTAPEQTQALELKGDGAAASWTLFRPHDQAPATYRYRTTLFGNDGTVNTLAWREEAERQLIVGDRFEGLLEVEVRFLVPDFAAAGFLGAKLRLEYPEVPPQAKGSIEKFFTGVPVPFVWKVPKVTGAGRKYRHTVQWVRASGTPQTVGPTDADEELLLIFPPIGG